MKRPRVTADEMFALADWALGLAARAQDNQQQPVLLAMNEVIAKSLDAAKSAAFNEAQNAWNEKIAAARAAEQAESDPTVKP